MPVDAIAPKPATRQPHLSGTTLIYLVATLSILVTVGLFGLLAGRDRAQMFREARIVTANLAEVLAEHTARLMDVSDFVLREALHLIGPRALALPANSAAHQELTRLVEATPFILSVWFGDADGDAVLAIGALPRLERAEVTGRLLHDLREADAPFSLCTATTDDGQTVLVMSRPLPATPDSFRGFVAATLLPEDFRKVYGHFDVRSGLRTALVRPDGDVLAHGSPPPLIPSGGPAGRSNVLRVRPPSGGEEQIVAYRRIDGYGLYAIAGLPRAWVEAQWNRQIRGYASYGIAALLAVAGLTALALQRARRERQAQQALLLAKGTLEQRVAERTADLEQALRDKEALLREVHHRVKNNLQVVASLLRLQSRQVAPEARPAFEVSLDRIYSISLVHDLLYRSGQASRINFGDYMQELCNHLRSARRPSAADIDIRVGTDPCTFDIDTASALALLVSELVTNALKHAFPGHARGTIQVTLSCRSDGAAQLVVADDGIGVPEDLLHRRQPGLGLVLVRHLARQVGGTLRVARLDGFTAFIVTFAMPKAEAADT